MSQCPKHFDKSISWICLDTNCEFRVMCNVCAVKIHNRNHRVEELEKIQKLGFINIFFDSEDNFQQSVNDELKEWENLKQPEDTQDVEDDLNFLLKQIEEKIKTLLQSFNQLQQNVQMTQQNEYEKLKLDKEQAVQKLSEIQQNIQKNVTEDYLSSQIKEAILIVNEKLKKKNQNPFLYNLQRKKELLSQIKKDFLKLSKSYFENKFTTDFCNMFDIQLDTLSKEQNPNIMNENKFTDFVNKKWKKDYNILQGAIELSTQKLNKVLKYTLDENNNNPQSLQQQYLSMNESVQQNNSNLYDQLQQQYIPVYYPQQLQGIVYSENYQIYNEPIHQNILPIHHQNLRNDQYYESPIRYIQKR